MFHCLHVGHTFLSTLDIGRGEPIKKKTKNKKVMCIVLCVVSPSSGCLLLCLCVSVGTLLLQSLWVPGEEGQVIPAGRSPDEQGESDMHLSKKMV